ncbi:bifunctional peptidase and arginyl-hydroxylase JMJD5 [Cylas formicarius]|uniref:bifunctional peptidase and arginyl-hydroxylase JMJD5 n=1 Tax=Cylas formicarius TaxID=197179 RepID=UPI0029586983|nr:bifunctional peptidase and arginyl-hydroxylase JMJD5 [Cylas formicarius]
MGTENDVAQKLLQIFQIPYESCILSNCNKVVVDTFKECLDSMVRDIQDEALLLKIDSVLDYLHDTLNTGHWSEVPLNTRQGFSNASFVKALIVIRHYKKSWKEALREGLKCLDLGLLLGAPSENLTRCAELLRLEINKVDVDQTIVRPSIKRKCNDEDYKLTLLDLPGSSVPEVEVPSIEAFNNYYFLPQVPGILKNCMSHWPALTKWQDLGYLLRVAGERTVPVEIGSNYMDQNWSQKLMTVNEYIKKFYLSETGQIGYLAQHNLFDQFKL